ncbi:hypothetical protein BRD02_10490, partial [Halobacteriales archaeon QS_8_69_73]
MDAPDRRRLLAAIGSAGATGLLAGCGGTSPDGTPEPTSTASPTAAPESRLVKDGVVDYPGMIDGAATVENADGGSRIEYDDPPRAFRLEGAFEGESRPSELAVGRDMTVDARAGFVAPMYDDSAEAFVFRLFADGAFVDYADWRLTSLANGRLTPAGAVPFERIEGDVYGAGVSPGTIDRLFLVDATAEELQGGTDGLSGIVVLVGRPSPPEPVTVPQTRFGFDYDAGAETLTITHEEGDTV